MVWHDYFPAANVYGIDVVIPEYMTSAAASMPRVHLIKDSSANVASFHFAPESMDVIIDDHIHGARSNERTLLRYWQYVKPGGFYCIEDIATGTGQVIDKDADYLGTNGKKNATLWAHADGTAPIIHRTDWQDPKYLEILRSADVFFADTQVAHRAFDAFKRAPLMRLYMKDRLNHNSHVLVLRKKRVGEARRRSIKVNKLVPFKGLKKRMTAT